MVKFLIGLVTGIALVFLTVVLLFFALLRFREKPPQIDANSVLVLRLAGEIPEKPPLELPSFLAGDRAPVTVAGVWMSLKKAAADPHIKAVALEPVGVTAGWARLEELRMDIEQFRKSGKPVYAYLRTPGTREYYLAAAAERIYLGPADQMYVKGLRAELMYFKKTLDKLGVAVEVEHAGKYKDFGDMFTRTDMGPETREVMSSVVDDLYGNMLARIAAGRKKSPDEMRAIIDQGPFTATQALKTGLVDELRFEDQMWGELKDRLHSGDPVKVSLDKYLKVPPESVGIQGKNHVALVIGEGDIVRGDPSDDGSAESSLTAHGFVKLLRQVAGDATVKAVVVRINSPGGEVTASDEIWREMNLLSKKKPTVISMSDAAASGGYYMAMTGDPIVAYPGTLTGSIGVVFGKPNLHGLYDKFGVTKDSIERGRHAGIDSDYRPLTEDERQMLRAGIDESYRDFVTKVADARHRTFEQIEPLSQGRVWMGDQAKANGLVDELGGLDTAVDLAKKKANIPAAENVTIVMYPARRDFLEILMRKSSGEMLESSMLESSMLESRLTQVFGRMPFHAWMKGGYLRLMPWWMEVR